MSAQGSLGRHVRYRRFVTQLTCACCGHSATFETPLAARDAAWQCPPFVDYVACDLCPGSLVQLRATHRHARAHERWQTAGRPRSITEQFLWGDLPTNIDEEFPMILRLEVKITDGDAQDLRQRLFAAQPEIEAALDAQLEECLDRRGMPSTWQHTGYTVLHSHIDSAEDSA